MRRAQRIFLAFLVAGLLLASGTPGIVGQGGIGALRVETDYELIGVSELSGGGHVTWTLTEDVARDLRAKIVAMFNEYPQIPSGFTFGGASTSAVPNGIIDRAEALAYTAYLENELEGVPRGITGTDVGYLRVDRADLLDASSIERSTSGLIDTDANSTAPLQIRFLFNAHTTTLDAPFVLPTRAFADALHDVFSFRRAQPSNLTTGGADPLLQEGGWRVVSINNTTALWAGDSATGRYVNDASNATRTTILIATRPGLDLRFASSARATFQYRGQVADVNDALRFEVSLGPSYTTWTTLRSITPTNGAWRNETVDLNLFLGQQPRFRFLFTSDSTGTAEGFFLRDFAIDAPSRFDGFLVEAQAHYLIGALCLTELNVSVGGVNVIRTPGGEILWYGATWSSEAPPPDALRFQTFSFLENPQILFAVMLAAAYFISRSQESAYDRYREGFPAALRPSLRRTPWLHILGKASMAVLLLLYFVPTAFFNIGIRAFVSGPAYWLLAVSLALGLGLGTRFYYEQRLETPSTEPGKAAAPVPATMKPESGPARCAHCLREIGKEERTFTCACGATYHLTCASDLERCPNCRKPIVVEVVPKKRTVAVRCGSCGRAQPIPEGSDPRLVACTACGKPLRRIEEGKGYLLTVGEPGVAFAWLTDLAKGGKPGLVMTPAAPERLRLEYGLQGIDVVRVSATEGGAVDPRRLDPDGLKAILPLTRSDRGGVLLIDGLEQIVAGSSVSEVVRFLRKASDMAFVHKVSVIARVAPESLGKSDFDRLRGEFDESIDLSTPG